MISPAEKQIHLIISDGLGNQMFQYAAGISLALKRQAQLILEPLPYYFSLRRPRQFSLPFFSLSSPVKISKPTLFFVRKLQSKQSEEVALFRELNAYQFEEAFFKLECPIRLMGFFQNIKYFEDLPKSFLQKSFSPQAPISKKASQLLSEISQTDRATCIHFRLGDYKNSPIFNPLSVSYYKDAIKILQEQHYQGSISSQNPVFWIFSNGKRSEVASFCRELGIQHSRVVGKSELSDWETLHLMSHFTNHIIANSTFSWWAAWLKNASGTTIMPKQWFKNPLWKAEGLKLKDWIEI